MSTPMAIPLVMGMVCSAVSAIPPQLTTNLDTDGQVSVHWIGTGVLERANRVTGPWESVVGAQSGWKTPGTGTGRFFRVRSAFRVQVNIEGSGRGTVTSDPVGLACPGDCSELFDEGSVVTLRALADTGSTFAGWSGDCTGTGDCLLDMDGPKTLIATFEAASPAGDFVNGDFEQGPVGWLQQPSNMIYTAAELGVSPYGGNYAAWVGFHPDSRRSAAIGQQLTLPSTWPLYLNFAIWLYSEELCDPPWWDTFGAYVNGEPLLENPHLCSGNTGGDGWRRISLDLSPYAGQTVLIGFEISSVDALASVALLDDVAISNAPW